jgi:pimeloyl-ACP methyl ester carboxylesterase
MPVVQCNGADLYYEDHGEGKPIVFLHGGRRDSGTSNPS